MPIYKYRAVDDHSKTWEVEQAIADKPKLTACHGIDETYFSTQELERHSDFLKGKMRMEAIERVIQPPTFHLKGAGFHKNDYPSEVS